MKNKRKGISAIKTSLTAVLATACVAAASIGFASWVIAAQDYEQTANISVVVDDIEDQSLTVSNISASDDNGYGLSVVFGHSTATTTNALLSTTTTDTTKAEDLKYGFTFSLSENSAGAFAAYSSIGMYLEFPSGFENKHNSTTYTLVDLKGISTDSANPTTLFNYSSSSSSWSVNTTKIDAATSSQGNDLLTVATDSNTTSSPYTVNFTCKFSFGWGTAFNGKNPSVITDDMYMGGTASSDSSNKITTSTLKTDIIALQELNTTTTTTDDKTTGGITLHLVVKKAS